MTAQRFFQDTCTVYETLKKLRLQWRALRPITSDPVWFLQSVILHCMLFFNLQPMLMILQAKAMQSAALSTPSITPVSPALGPPSLEVKGPPGAKQHIAKALPKAHKGAGLGFMAKGVEAAKPRAAAGSRGQQHNPGGAGEPRIAARTPAALPAKSKPSTKAASGKAAAVSRSLLGQHSAGGAVESQAEQGQQQLQGHGERSRPWLISSHLVQLVPGKVVAPTSGSQHCNRLDLPSSIMQGWYPDLQPGSSLHLQIKVPPAAATAQNAPHCGPSSQGMPEQEDAMGVSPSTDAQTRAFPIPACETVAESGINNKRVQYVVAKKAIHQKYWRLDALQQVLHPYMKWKLAFVEKVRSESDPCRANKLAALFPYWLVAMTLPVASLLLLASPLECGM